MIELDNVADLKKSLSLSLQDALDSHLVSGENVIIALPGSFGEAFAASDKRAFVIRDCESGLSSGCKVFGYLLSTVIGASVASSGTGGYIELNVNPGPADIEESRVYFPSYDQGAFQSAADYLNKILLSEPAQQAASAPAPVGAVGNKCPKCGAVVEESSVFCGSCGEQLRQICSECSASSPVGAKYCSHCGRKLYAFNSTCPKCGSRVQRWMRYCTECGSILEKACMACGSAIVSSWTHCANCGRLLGSDRLDPRTAMHAQRRLQEFQEVQSQQPEQVVQQPEVASPSKMVAEDYNKRGLKFFEDGDPGKAVSEFKMAVELEPDNASYHCNLAVAYDEDDQDGLAMAEYFKTLELDPKDLTALLSLGYMYNEHEEQDKAQEVWNKVLVIAPDSPEAQEVRENLRHQEQI